MQKFDFKKLYPHLIAIGVFIFIAFAYASPVMQGKELRQDDIVQWRGGAQESIDFREETGKEPLWTNSMFGGMPGYIIDVNFPKNVLSHIHTFLMKNIFPRPANFIFYYLLGFYILLLGFGMSPFVSMIGAFAFSFASYNFIIIEAGHNNKVRSMIYLGPALAGIWMAYRGKLILGAAVAAFFLGLMIHMDHIQVVYYLMMMILIFGIVYLIYAIKENSLNQFLKVTGVLFIAALLALGANTARIWVLLDHSNDTMRGGQSELVDESERRSSGLDKDYALMWSYGKLETMTFLIPNFYGGGNAIDIGENSSTYQALTSNNVPPAQARSFVENAPMYWGDQPFTSGPVYMGAIVCLLFVMGLVLIKGPFKVWLLVTVIITLFLSWGKNFEFFTDLFFYYFPLYNKFRAVTMILMITQVAMALLAFATLWNIINLKYTKDQLINALKIGLGVTGGLAAAFAILGGIFFDFRASVDSQLPQWIVSAIHDDRASMLRMDAFRTLFFVAAASAAIFFFYQKKLSQNVFLGILALLFVIDMWPVNKRYFNNDDFLNPAEYEQIFAPTQADLQILQDPDIHYRVFNTTRSPFNDAITSYHHKSVGGYHPAKLLRYQDLIDEHLREFYMPVLNMLNTKYFIVQQEEGAPPTAQLNQSALGNAWVVNEARIAETAREAIDFLGEINTGNTVVIESRERDYVNDFDFSSGRGEINLLSYSPLELVYEADIQQNAFVVFSEIYYNGEKGWNAYLNGEKVDHIRVNYVLRGMKLPAGNHELVFRFEPSVYFVSSNITLVFSLILCLFFIGTLIWYFGFSDRKKVPEEKKSLFTFD